MCGWCGCKDASGHSCKNSMMMGLLVFLVGLVYVLQDLGYVGDFRIGLFPLLVLLFGLYWMHGAKNCEGCKTGNK